MERAGLELWRAKEVARLLSLVETERRYYQDILAALPLPVAVLSKTLALQSANQAFRQLFGLSHEAAAEAAGDQVVPIPEFRTAAEKALAGSPHSSIHHGVPTAQGLRALRISLAPIRDWDDPGEPELVLVAEDLSEPVSAALEEAERRTGELRQRLEEQPAVAWELDAATMRFGHVNEAAVRLLGLPAEQWRAGADFFTGRVLEADLPAVKAFYQLVLAGGPIRSCDYRVPSGQGESRWLRDVVRMAGAGEEGGVRPCGLTFDITAARRRDRFVATSAKLEGLSQLAGRVVHDCNNLLMILSGYAEELLHALTPDNALRANVQEILNAGDRLSALVSRLSEFTARPALEPRATSVDETLAALREELRGSLPAEVSLAWSLESGAAVHVDPRVLRGCVRTLARRAADAMRQGGTLSVATSVEEVTDAVVDAEALAAGPCVCISVRDTGMAIHPEMLARVFEPPLEAGPPGRSLLGVYQAVRDSGGEITVESAYEAGTCFTMRFPVAAGAAAEEAAPAGRETLLVVEDEPGIRALIRKVLERHGYVVLEAGGGAEALQAASAHPGEIHLLLTDVMMPGMTGLELAEKLRQQRPEARTLFISGYTGPAGLDPFHLPAGTGFLQKPFTLALLVEKVREVLSAPPTSAASA